LFHFILLKAEIWSNVLAASRIQTGNLQQLSRFGGVAKLLSALHLTADPIVSCSNSQPQDSCQFLAVDVVVAKIVQLIQVVASHSMTVKDLRSILSAMRAQQAEVSILQ
jgi:hypothetical protein